MGRLLLVLIPLGLVAAGIYGIYGIKGLAARRRQRRLDAQLEDIKEIAWQHRDLAPELSTIIIDEIRKKQKENK